MICLWRFILLTIISISLPLVSQRCRENMSQVQCIPRSDGRSAQSSMIGVSGCDSLLWFPLPHMSHLNLFTSRYDSYISEVEKIMIILFDSLRWVTILLRFMSNISTIIGFSKSIVFVNCFHDSCEGHIEVCRNSSSVSPTECKRSFLSIDVPASPLDGFSRLEEYRCEAIYWSYQRGRWRRTQRVDTYGAHWYTGVCWGNEFLLNGEGGFRIEKAFY